MTSTPSHFIHYLADKIAEQDKRKWKNTLVILPSRRAALHLRNALYHRAQSAFVHPMIHTSESWMRDLTSSRKLEPAKELAVLYDAYKETHSPNPESFDSFLKWAPTFISDLNEADRYMCPLDELYKFTFDIKRLESWDVSENPEEQTELVRSYLKFWERLPETRKAFHDSCIKSGEYPQGLSFRVAAEGFETIWPVWKKQNAIDRIVISGINAMNKAEEVIYSTLGKEGAEFIYDLPEILSESKQEAGQFIRNYLKWDTQNYRVSEPKISESKKWTISSSPGHQEQFQLAGNIIKGLIDAEGKDVLERTALVLSDEQWLLPALNALPDEVDKVNITMGLPLQDHPMTQLISRSIKLMGDWSEGSVRTQLLKDIVNSISQLTGNFDIRNTELPTSSRIKEEAWNKFWKETYVEGLRLSELRHPLEASIHLCQWLIQRVPSGMNKMCLEEIEERLLQIEKLSKQVSESGLPPQVKSIEQVFRILMKDARIDFQGEPLEGLQIMGILESRSLEFDHIIFTSLNEGILPKGRPVNSLFPYEVRKTFKLPDHGEKDSIYGYHFFRLLSRSKDARLIYSEGSDGINAAERSRFLLQLEHEWKKFYGNKLQLEKSQTIIRPGTELLENRISKSPEVMEKLRRRAAKGFSPSALTLYLKDPIKFFLNYLSGIQDQPSINTLDSRGFGQVYHKAMEFVFAPFVGKSVDISKLKEQRKRVKHFVLMACEDQKVDIEMLSGQEALGFDMLQPLIEKSIDQDLELMKKNTLEIIHLEQWLELQLPGGMKIHGLADRIDKVNNKFRIVDYKTGSVNRGKLKVNTADQLEDGEHSQAFQLLCYALMARKTFGEDEIKTTIYMTKEWSIGPANLNFVGSEIINDQSLQEFEIILQKVINEIMDPEKDFTSILENSEEE